uniref:Frag1/DRAM/Sfk1 family-domain-containing protein n=1 Tax=Panagrellus redivivus TaxID=6233 RepID=A0A7E4ZTC5_PANRE
MTDPSSLQVLVEASSTSSSSTASPVLTPNSTGLQMNVPGPPDCQGDSNWRRIASYSAWYLFVLCLAPPLIALFADFIIGFAVDYDQLLNYEWTCGKAYLPSVSRIVNLPKERTVFHLGSLGSITFRCFIVIYYYRLARRLSISRGSRIWRRFVAPAILLSGLGELVFQVAITVVGEREHGDFHMYFFISFTLCAVAYFLLITIVTRYRPNYGDSALLQASFRLKLLLLVMTVLLIPTIGTFFVLYWGYCVTFAYNAFALSEYVTILAIFGFHSTAMLDLKHLHFAFIVPKRNN